MNKTITKTEKRQGFSRLTVRMPLYIKKKIAFFSERNRESMNDYIVSALEYFFEENEDVPEDTYINTINADADRSESNRTGEPDYRCEECNEEIKLITGNDDNDIGVCVNRNCENYKIKFYINEY